MMSTGTPGEMAERERKARLLMERLAETLNEIDGIEPGCIFASNGKISGFGTSVAYEWGTGWVVADS